MTTTYDPENVAYLDEADVRGELTRVFDVCGGCRRCVDLCSSFPSLFQMLDGAGGRDAGSLTPVDQDRVVDECFQCRMCRANCPYVPGSHELAIDFPRLMSRARSMRHAAGERTLRAIIADQVLGRTDCVGKIATRTAPVVNRVVGVEPGTVRRRLLAQLTGITARHRLTPYSTRRFSSWNRGRPAGGGVALDRKVTLLPTCLVEYRRPEIGTALVEVYSRNGIACEVSRVGCCGAPWLTAGDTRRFGAQASRTVAALAAAIRAGTDVVVAQPTCHAVITTDYVDFVGGADAEMVAGRTFEAVRYLAGQPAGQPAGQVCDRLLAGTSVVHHEPCPVLGDESPSPARQLLERAGATVIDVRRCMGVDGRWGLRASNERVSLARAEELGAEIARTASDVVTGSCVLANTSIAQQIGRVVIHPLEVLANAE